MGHCQGEGSLSGGSELVWGILHALENDAVTSEVRCLIWDQGKEGGDSDAIASVDSLPL